MSSQPASSATQEFPAPVVAWAGSADAAAPLVVLLHGRGADERSILGVSTLLPPEAAIASVRAPIAEGGGFAWFANRGIGRPVAESLAATTAWFRAWLDPVAPAGRAVVLIGFSGGAAFAGGLILAQPARYRGAAILYGTLPFDAGLTTDVGQLEGLSVLVAQGENDVVIPRELLDRTWQYLGTESGATVTAYRDAGGHGLSERAADALARWVRTLTVDS